ncbi:siderophore-interacting protein [Nocardiopsis coralliicola]
MTAAAVPPAPRLELYPLKPRLLEVGGVERVTPRMIRVQLAGADAEGFASDNFDDHVKIFLPPEGSREPALPQVAADGRWNMRAPGLTYRDYTVRRFADGVLTVDFVAHGHGPAGRWAMDARPGDTLGVLGPRGTLHVAGGYGFHLLGADETALPALARRLEELPEDAHVIAFAEVADAAEERYLDRAAGARVTWLHRGGTEPGAAGLLARALDSAGLPAGTGFAWFGGEAAGLKPVRRRLAELGFVRKANAVVDGYWRRGTANLDHHAED